MLRPVAEHLDAAGVHAMISFANIMPRPPGLTRYPPIHDFFDVIDTPEKAYILGFIAGDGWVYPARNAIGIELSAKDVTHLHALRNRLSPMQPIRQHLCRINGREITQFRLEMRSRPMVEALARLGVGPAKSRTFVPPTLPAELEPHFWRGMLDADGSINLGSSAGWRLELVGSLGACDGFREFLVGRGIATTARLGRTHGVPRFELGGLNQVKQALALLKYDDDDVMVLGRKAAAAREVLATAGRFDRVQRVNPRKVAALREAGLDAGEIARALGVGPTSLWKYGQQHRVRTNPNNKE